MSSITKRRLEVSNGDLSTTHIFLAERYWKTRSAMVLRSLTLALTVVSIALAVLSIESPLVIDISSLGFFGNMTPAYILGFALCLLAIVFGVFTNACSLISIVQIILMEFYLWVIPLLIMPGLRFPAAAHDLFFYSTTASIVNSGHLQPQIYVYQSWPSPYIFAAIVKIMTPLSYVQLYLVTPLFMNMFVTLVAYCFFRAYLPDGVSRLAVIGVAFLQLFNYTEQFTTISPFSIAYLLFYAFCLTMLISWTRNRVISWKQVIIFVIFLIVISSSHPVIAVEMVMATVLVFSFTGLMYPASLRSAFLYLAIGFMVISSWTIYAGWPLFGQYAVLVISSLFGFISGILVPVSISLATGSPSHLLINYVKLVILVIMTGGAVPTLLTKMKRDKRIMTLFAFIFGIVLSGLVLGGAEGDSFYIYLFNAILPAIILLDLFSLLAISSRVLPFILVGLLIASAPVSVLVVYGNLQNESVSQPSLEASSYFSQFTPVPYPAGSTTISQDLLVGFYGNNLSTLLPFVNPGYTLYPELPNPPTDFVVLGQDAVPAISYTYGNSSFVQTMTTQLNRNQEYAIIYSSNYIVIYNLQP